MFDNPEFEIEKINADAEKLKEHYLDLAYGDIDEAYEMACRGECVVKYRLGQVLAERL